MVFFKEKSLLKSTLQDLINDDDTSGYKLWSQFYVIIPEYKCIITKLSSISVEYKIQYYTKISEEETKYVIIEVDKYNSELYTLTDINYMLRKAKLNKIYHDNKDCIS
jgi:hypothetical protein